MTLRPIVENMNHQEGHYADVQIWRDWETGRIFYTPFEFTSPFSSGRGLLASALEWDGRGMAFIGGEVMQDRLIQRRPDPCDTIEIDGQNYVVIERDIAMQGYRVMRESRAAHQLAIFHLTYWSDLAAQFWPIRAFERLNRDYLQDIDWGMF